MHGAALGLIVISAIAIVVGVFSRHPRNLGCYAAANGLDAIADLLDHFWPGAVVTGAVAVVLFLLWLRRRKRRAPKAMGAKSRALIAALVARLRETLKPKPALQPVPGGAA